jgi:hypothetical protein
MKTKQKCATGVRPDASWTEVFASRKFIRPMLIQNSGKSDLP